jgi:hypothetical protein
VSGRIGDNGKVNAGVWFEAGARDESNVDGDNYVRA